MAPGGWGQEDGELLFGEYRVSVLQDEKISGGWLHNNVNIPNTVEVYT